jgi:acyl dehydratase
MGKEITIGMEFDSAPHLIDNEKLVVFERVIWSRVANVHSDPAVAKRVGMSKTIASGQNQLAFMHQLMEENFCKGWTQGGKISASWVHPVYVGDTIQAKARVISIEDIDGRKRVGMEIWCENQSGIKTGRGTSHAFLD